MAATKPPKKARARVNALLEQREQMLRDLGGLLYEMYSRDRFRKELLDYKCAELARLEAEIRVLTIGPAPPPAPQPAAPTQTPQPPAPAA